MAAGLGLGEQFMVLFNNLKEAAKDDPGKVKTYYNQHGDIRRTLDALEDFLSRTDLERRVFHGPQKWLPQARPGFEAAWKEYDLKWRFRRVLPAPEPLPDPEPPKPLSEEEMSELIRSAFDPLPPKDQTASPPPEASPPPLDSRPQYEYVERQTPAQQRKPEVPDPEHEEFFDPIKHDGGEALKLGIDYLVQEADNLYDSRYRYNRDYNCYSIGSIDENSCRIGYEAYDYLVKTIGINIPEVFRRWRRVPVVFMPAHVSNGYGSSEKNSLGRQLDDAVRAYVCGVPAAAITMCRAALETVLKRHYGRGLWEYKKLGELIDLASYKYSRIVKKEKIAPFQELANRILHNYDQIDHLSEEDNREILDFFAELKFLIQKAPES